MWDLPDKYDFLDELIEHDLRYKKEAYIFVLDSLRATIENLQEARHVTGKELSQSCRRCALELYGPLARTVLDYWGIKSTEDFGEIVFNLIEARQLTKTEQDSKEDFKDVFDFEEAFEKNYPWGKVT
ncbi:MAG TPA: Minf_1886 family protein [archaeon]|nr:Minf_1886 family protein [archaeon]